MIGALAGGRQAVGPASWSRSSAGSSNRIDTFLASLAAVAHVVPSYDLADLGRTAIAARATVLGDVLLLTGYPVAIRVLVVWPKGGGGVRGGD